MMPRGKSEEPKSELREAMAAARENVKEMKIIRKKLRANLKELEKLRKGKTTFRRRI
jgi:hypothetical protein